MGGAGAGENRLGFGFAIRLPDLFHVQHCQHHAFGIAQRNFAGSRRQLLGKFLGHVQSDRHGPKRSIGQAHVVANAFVIGAGHEAAQRRKSAGEQQLEIAKLAAGQIPRGPLFRMGLQFGDSVGLGDELDKFSAVRRDEMAGRSGQVLSLLKMLKLSCLLRLLYLPGLLPRLQRSHAQPPCGSLTGEENPDRLATE